MIRRATLSDVPRIVQLGRKFHAYSIWRDLPYDLEAVARTAYSMVKNEDGAVFLSDDGLCGGLINALYFSPSHRIAVELFWYAPTEGKELREAFEAWAVERGADAIQFSALADDRRGATERLYRMAGYNPVETVLMKRVA